MIEKEYIYPGAIENIEKVLFKIKVKNILLVRGNQSFIKSGAKDAFTSISDKYNVVEFSDFSVNPKLEEAKVGYDLFKNNSIDVIIAVGGGSVIDTAKIIKYLAIQEDSKNTDISFIVAPTTAGTGSEATHFAVVYIDGVKHSWADNALIPTVSIVDANLLNGQTKYQIAVSGLDAFAQGVESFWSVNATEESKHYSEKAIKLMWENLANAVNGNEEALKNIAEGSNWAGKAIDISKTTAAHALSYHITSEFNLPHGHAVSLFLPYFITYNLYLKNKDAETYSNENEILVKLMKFLSIEDISKLDDNVRTFISNLGIEINFEKLGITKDDLITTLQSANPERLNNNPRKYNVKKFIDETSILSLFNSCKI